MKSTSSGKYANGIFGKICSVSSNKNTTRTGLTCLACVSSDQRPLNIPALAAMSAEQIHTHQSYCYLPRIHALLTRIIIMPASFV